MRVIVFLNLALEQLFFLVNLKICYVTLWKINEPLSSKTTNKNE